MTTITLPPEIERPLAEEAQRQGTTTELLTPDKLRALVAPEQAPEHDAPPAGKQPENLAEYLGDFIGMFDSGEHIPGGAQMSKDSGKKFAAGMVKKREEGHL